MSARKLAVPARTDGKTVTETGLLVSRSYYGAGRGDWRERSPGEAEVWRDCWGAMTGDHYLNGEVFFKNVPAKVWGYEVGGYPVLKKWLGYRHSDRRDGKPLSLVEAEHFRSMVQRLAALLVLAPDLDAAYEAASGDGFTADELGLR